MTTYQKGHEPAGAPVTVKLDDRVYTRMPKGAWKCGSILVLQGSQMHFALEQAATWRSLAELAEGKMEDSCCYAWLRDFAAAKERFHE